MYKKWYEAATCGFRKKCDTNMIKNNQLNWTATGSFCLMIAGLMEALSIIQLDFLNYLETYVAENYLVIPCTVFFGAALTVRQSKNSQRELLIGLMCVAWFMLLQILHRITEQGSRNLGFFACAVLLAYPYPAVIDDGHSRIGLRMIGGLFIGVATLLCAGGLLLKLEILPVYLENEFFWDGVRLHAARHPNISACVLMIAIAFSLVQFFLLRQRWKKVFLLLLVVVFFSFQALTNGRMAIMVTSGMICLIFLSPFYRKEWKRIVVLLLSGVVLAAALYSCATVLFYRNETSLQAAFYTHQDTVKQEPMLSEQIELKEPEIIQPVFCNTAEPLVQDAAPTSGDRTLKHQLFNLNGRLPTWNAAAKALINNPSLLLTGKHYVGEMLSYYRGMYVEHAHNSFLEVTLWLGLPGLAMALYFSFLAIREGSRVLLGSCDMEARCIALLTLCLLACSLLEPILFTGSAEYHFLNFVFFLCIGYLQQW